jgi:hypothetical protein
MKLPDLDRDVSTMSLEAMRAEFVALAEPFTAIDNRRRLLARLIADAEDKASAVARVSAMSEEEKAALRAALGA